LREFFGFGPAPKQVVLEPLPAQSAAPTEEDETELLPPPVTESARVAAETLPPDPIDQAVTAPDEEAVAADQTAEAAEETVQVAEAAQAADEALSAALDSLGQAHHRPFSRG
jgi:hypothetical protein